MSSPEPPSDAPVSLDSKSKSTSDLTTLKAEIIGAVNLPVGDTLQSSALSKKTKQKSSTRFLGKLGSKQFSKVDKEKEAESKKISNPKKSGLVSGLQNFFKSGSLSSKNTPSTGIGVKQSDEPEDSGLHPFSQVSVLKTIGISKSETYLAEKTNYPFLESQTSADEEELSGQENSPLPSPELKYSSSHEDFKKPKLIDRQNDTVPVEPTTSMTTTSVPSMHAGDTRQIVDSLSLLAGSSKFSNKSSKDELESDSLSDHEYSPHSYFPDEHPHGLKDPTASESEHSLFHGKAHGNTTLNDANIAAKVDDQIKVQRGEYFPWLPDSGLPCAPVSIGTSHKKVAGSHTREGKKSERVDVADSLSSSPKLSLSPVPDSAKIRCVPIPEPLLVRPLSRSSSSAGSGEFSSTEKANSPRSHGSPLATPNRLPSTSRPSSIVTEGNYFEDEHGSNRLSSKVFSPLTNGRGWTRSRRSSLIDTVMNVNKFSENVRKPQDLSSGSNDSDLTSWRRARTTSYNGEGSPSEWGSGPKSPLALASTNSASSSSTLSGRYLVRSKRASLIDANFADDGHISHNSAKFPSSKLPQPEFPKTRHRRVLSVSNVRLNRFQATKAFTDNISKSWGKNALGIENINTVKKLNIGSEKSQSNCLTSKPEPLNMVQPTYPSSTYSYSTSEPSTPVGEVKYQYPDEYHHISSLFQNSTYLYASKLYQSRVAKAKDWSRHKPSAETHWFNWIYNPPLADGYDRPLDTYKKHREYLLWWNQVVDICYELLETPMNFDLPSTYEEFQRNKRLHLHPTPLSHSKKKKPSKTSNSKKHPVFDHLPELVPMSRAVSYSGCSSTGNGKVFRLSSLPSEVTKRNLEKDIRYRKRQCDQFIREFIEILNQFVEGTLNYVEEEDDADDLSNDSYDDQVVNYMHNPEFKFGHNEVNSDDDSSTKEARSFTSTPTISVHADDEGDNTDLHVLSTSPKPVSFMDREVQPASHYKESIPDPQEVSTTNIPDTNSDFLMHAHESPKFDYDQSNIVDYSSNDQIVQRWAANQASRENLAPVPLQRRGSVVVQIAEDSFCPTPFLQKAMDFISIGQDILDIDQSKLTKGKMENYINIMTKIQNQWYQNNWPHKDIFSRLLTLMGYLNISIQLREAEKFEKEYAKQDGRLGDGKNVIPEEDLRSARSPKEVKPKQKRRRAKKSRSDANKTKNDINELRKVVEEGQGVSIVMELTLNDVQLRYLSPAWKELMGSDPHVLLGHSIAEFLPDSDSDIFSIATSQLLYDDTQTIEVRFSLLRKNLDGAKEFQHWATMEAKGILGYSDHINGEPSHTLWVIQPVNESEEDSWKDSELSFVGSEDFDEIDTPDNEESPNPERNHLIRDDKFKNSGYCSESGSQSGSPMPLQPLPPHVLCHICERMVSPLFFETHSELCTEVHQVERRLQACDDSLQETRAEIYEICTTIQGSTEDVDLHSETLEILRSTKHILDLTIAIKAVDTQSQQPSKDMVEWKEVSAWSPSTVDPGIQQLLLNVQMSIKEKLEVTQEMLSVIRKGEKAEAQWEAKMRLEWDGGLIDEHNIEEFNLDQSVLKPVEMKRTTIPTEELDPSKHNKTRSRRPRLTLKEIDNVQSPLGSPKSSKLWQDNLSSNTAYSPTLGPTTPGPRPVQISIKDFEIIKPISKGAFGSVYLAKKRTTGEYFAIKVLKKSDMIAKNQVMNVKAERKALIMQTDSPFVVKLYFTFQSKDYLYLVMEYLNGGDCAALIKGMGELPEEWARNYLAEVVLGLEYLHGKGIVHRDLKPDNLLIDQNGHLKLTDFGLSRIGFLNRRARNQSTSLKVNVSGDKRDSYGPPSPYLDYPSGSDSSNTVSQSQHQFHVQSFLESRRNSITSNASDSISNISIPGTPLGNLLLTDEAIQNLKDEEAPKTCIGTPDYLAPESILGTGQDAMVDWWALGVILYEFLYGIPPFNADSPEEVFENILSRNIDWYEGQVQVSPEARNLMEQLMSTDVEKRLGANGVEEVKNHPFFAGIDWDILLTERPIFIPQPESIEDTDYFDGRGALMAHFDADEHPELSEADPVTDQSSTHRDPANDSELQTPPADSSMSEADAVDFGNFSYKNLEVLAKANDDVIRRLKSDPSIAGSAKRHSMIHLRSDSDEQNLTIPATRSRNISVPSALNSSLMKTFNATMSSSLPNSRMSWCGRPSFLPETPGESTKRQLSLSRPRTASLASPSRLGSPITKSACSSLSRSVNNDNRTSLNCLIVDDNAISAKLLERILEKLHCNSVVCYNGAEAIRCCMGKAKFDIIFMDIKMPIIDGFTAARMIKSTKNLNQDTPIIAVTAYERNVPQAGLFDVVLSKIVTKEKIGPTLKEYCSWSPNRQRNRS